MDSQGAIAWRVPLLMAGVGLSAFASGTLASLSLVTVPALLASTTNASLLNGWRHTLLYGFKVCPPFAVAASIAHVFNAYLNRGLIRAKYSAVAAVCTIGIVPFTIIFLSSTNEELFKREKAARGTAADVESSSLVLVKKWGRLNLTRSFLPAVGALIACFTL